MTGFWSPGTPDHWHKGSENLVLDHYLEVLVHRPGALAAATALVILAELPKVHGQVPQAGC